MKKQLRTIIVGEETYRWLVTPVDQNLVCLKIWHSDNRSMPWAVVKYRFDDPWLNYGVLVQSTPADITTHFQLTPIRPSTVAEMITAIHQISGVHSEKDLKTLHLQCDKNGELRLS